jgi:hypothetical protein
MAVSHCYTDETWLRPDELLTRNTDSVAKALDPASIADISPSSCNHIAMVEVSVPQANSMKQVSQTPEMMLPASGSMLSNVLRCCTVSAAW